MYRSNISEGKGGYVAPVLGNGNMSFQADYEGTMQHEPDFEGIRNNSDLRIWWAGRRYMHKMQKDLISFGCFSQKIVSGGKDVRIKEFEQKLDTKAAVMRTQCKYENDIKIETEMFIHHDYNLIAVKKDISGDASYNFDYHLCGVKETDTLPELMTVLSDEIEGNSINIRYKADAGMYPYEGKICVFGENILKCEIHKNRYSLMADKSAVFYILFCDNVDCEDFEQYAERIKREALSKGFEALKQEHSEKWRAYMDEGYAFIDDETINSAYSTAQYHLKCYTTKWSLPVGLNNGSWHGKCFAFDEFYMMMGLLTSNHLNAAKKIPVFRHAGLKYAVERGSHGKCEPEAHYPWETLENGTEGAINGFWHDHVFHMASISCGEYYYYKFSKDKLFLKDTAYPVIKACASFYINHMIYKTEGGRMIVGKCTDLERLGSSRENAYMTTCGVIKTLLIFDEVAAILGTDKEMAKKCREIAGELKQGLPNDGEKYIPYAGCPDASIGLLSGTYPFDVIERSSKLQKRGIESYLESENRVGNMYSVGTGVCSWYMTWKALVFARFQRKNETLEAIKNAAKNTGYFGEMYEINDMSTNTFFRPWFTTAAGMLIHSVNEMFLQYKDDTVIVAPALPEAVKDFSFKLAVYDGLCVTAEVKEGRLKNIEIENKGSYKDEYVNVVIPKHILVENDGLICDKENNVIKVRCGI